MITTKAELDYVVPSILDGEFSLADLNYDARTGTFSLKCWTLERAQESRKQQICKAHLLRFSRVTNCEIEISERVEHYEVSRVIYKPQDRVVEIRTHYALAITLTVEDLAADLYDLDETRKE
jgi:hypothetical protein